MSEKSHAEKGHAETGHTVKNHEVILQCDPGDADYREYTISQVSSVTGSYVTIGYMVVSRITSASGSFAAGTEYWYMSSNVAPGYALSFAWVDYTWAGTPSPPYVSGTASFTNPQVATWSGSSAPTSGASMFVNNGQGAVCLSWGMSNASGAWAGTLTWYSPTGTNTVFGGMNSPMYLAPNTTPQLSWFSATLRV